MKLGIHARICTSVTQKLSRHQSPTLDTFLWMNRFKYGILYL